MRLRSWIASSGNIATSEVAAAGRRVQWSSGNSELRAPTPEYQPLKRIASGANAARSAVRNWLSVAECRLTRLIRLTLADYLQDQGFKVLEATTGDEALDEHLG